MLNARFINVQDILDNYKSAIYEKDVERFLSSYHSEIHIFDCWDNWECIGITQWRQMVKEWFNGLSEEGVLLKVDFTDLVMEETLNIAIVHCSVKFSAYNQSDEKLRQTTNRFTFCLKKENELWTIIHEHSSLPINIETGKGIFNYT
ncbi:nuclear transport factor 2 family protein [Neobacillus sp. PS3-40]|uniref:YybH family protein n=1 Tax=Neobacillus sp. PS3-40 TaxID=3070679 RepID=UPI0027DFC7E2|nr:nuclear transport factor 2 family protein [Neobacillus sp. PS3-40]WML44643.1 nuclear transport factor 2 family protein [Neobacillus sp. PS3-40]